MHFMMIIKKNYKKIHKKIKMMKIYYKRIKNKKKIKKLSSNNKFENISNFSNDDKLSK